jgi:hypothetical protein
MAPHKAQCFVCIYTSAFIMHYNLCNMHYALCIMQLIYQIMYIVFCMRNFIMHHVAMMQYQFTLCIMYDCIYINEMLYVKSNSLHMHACTLHDAFMQLLYLCLTG